MAEELETDCGPNGMPMNTDDSLRNPSQDDVDQMWQKLNDSVTNIRQRSRPLLDGISNLTRQCATITLRTAIMVNPQLLHQLDMTETKGSEMDDLVALVQAKKNELTSLADDDDDIERLLGEIDDLTLNDDSDDDVVIELL